MEISTKQSNWLVPLGIFFISLGIFTWGLASQEIIGFESRFYFFALEMWRYGFNWFPTTYQQPYADYPVTATFLIYLFAKLFGSLNKLSAVFPSAIAASFIVSVTYLIGSVHTKRLGIAAVCFLFLTLFFLKSARSISLDMYPALAVTCCFYLVYSAEINHKPNRAHWIYLFFFLGFLFRGPIGLIMPAGVVCVYYFINRDFKKFFISGFLALLVLVLCMLILVGLANYVGGQTFMQDVLRMQVLGRMDNEFLPVYFYFINSFGSYALSYPLAWVVIFALLYQFLHSQAPRPEAKLLIQLLGWMLVILIGMSIPGDKKVRYILPMVPACALMAAFLFAPNEKEKYFHLIGQVISKIFLFFPAIFLLATEIIFFYTKKHAWAALPVYFVPVIIFFIALQLFAFWMVYRDIRYPKKIQLNLLFIATVSFIVMYIAVIEPITLYVERAREFVQSIETQRLEKRAELVFYKEKPDGLPIKYLLNTVEVEHPEFIDTEAALINFTRPAFFVTREAYFSKLPDSVKAKFKIIGNEKMGHVRIVVFTNQE